MKFRAAVVKVGQCEMYDLGVCAQPFVSCARVDVICIHKACIITKKV